MRYWTWYIKTTSREERNTRIEEEEGATERFSKMGEIIFIGCKRSRRKQRVNAGV